MTLQALKTRAAALDAADPLAGFREQFYLPQGCIYLDGNSLGPLCRPAEAAVQAAMQQWRTLAVDGWTDAQAPWFTLAERLSEQMAQLMGAERQEVIVTNSTTVNLHQLLATFYDASSDRFRMLADAAAFPSDLYAIRSHLRLRGVERDIGVTLIGGPEDTHLDEEQILDALDKEAPQVAVLPAVVYTSGQRLDVESISQAAHEAGVLIGWDCSHSAGIMPHHLSSWGVDFAFWCGYKYLNGGPGAVAALYVNRRHLRRKPGLAGWFGSRKERQFEMLRELDPAPAAGRFQIGSPHILSMAPLIGSLPMLLEAGIDRIRAKSLELTGLMMEAAAEILAPLGVETVTPAEPDERGGHVAFRHTRAAEICEELRRRGVVPDFRPPDILRLAPAPLYTRFAECVEAIERMREVIAP